MPAAPSVAAKHVLSACLKQAVEGLRPMARFAALAELTDVRRRLSPAPSRRFQLMKGHEDGGTDMFFGMGGSSSPTVAEALSAAILRKEVIQPQVPLRLPCYDFTPVAKPTVVACLSCELAQRLRVNPTPMV